MTGLYLGMAALLALAAALVLLPSLVRVKRHSKGMTQRQLNLELYRHRLDELKGEREQGLVDAGRFDELDSELKRSLLDDTEQPQGRGNTAGWKLLLPGLLVLVLGTLGLYRLLGAEPKLAHWQQVMAGLPSLAERVLKPKAGQELSRDEMQDLALGIRTRLLSRDDKNAWVFLGKVGFALEEASLSQDAYRRALAMDPDNSGALLGLAQSLLADGGEAGISQAGEVLGRLLAKEPGNQDAMLLSGLVAFEHQDYDQAATLWQQLKGQLPEGDPRKALLDQRIQDARAKLKGKGRHLLVKVALAPALAGQLPKDASLFVFARGPQGGPPLAAVRLPLSRLPTEVELSDATSMIPGRSLGDADQYQIGARISQSGMVGKSQSGDLSGEAGPVEASQQHVNLIIDTRIP
ncbi:c-type cytochrome biogenesis protein CcmI [Gallaecimonas kandeliae]|uniref:c-type cytochrome biogenesis protein CcmI n=1 Tax=Gallaecimonas kandeliae TaxID=3029055 RepID=UPI002647B511|nr:c-type cytochrome biogenesis protein CcmI [Gallaecimonas kandeliae]WKE66775.1 c-type cytochrome biogenesis protein CcmI [Gallaecimonas kandeliae]